jgi:hypothetical protein
LANLDHTANRGILARAIRSTTAISGTFAGLPEGAVIAAGHVRFSISYTGCTGNDVVTVLSVVPDYLLSEGATGSFSPPTCGSPIPTIRRRRYASPS